jgi:hypothetical protein
MQRKVANGLPEQTNVGTHLSQFACTRAAPPAIAPLTQDFYHPAESPCLGKKYSVSSAAQRECALRLSNLCAEIMQILCVTISMLTAPIANLQNGASSDQFMASLRDPDNAAPIVSARRFGEALHIDLQTLAEQAHVHRNTLSRQPASESVQRFLREALRVIRAATDISGDVNRTLFWYRNEPLPVFDYKTAEQLVSDGRTDDLLRYVSSLEAGAAG